VVSFTPMPLYPRGKSLRYPLDRRLGGPQSRSGRLREEKIRHCRDSNSDPSVIQPVVSRYTDYAIPAPYDTPSYECLMFQIPKSGYNSVINISIIFLGNYNFNYPVLDSENRDPCVETCFEQRIISFLNCLVCVSLTHG
jgi:hypothetical protein